MRNDSKQSKTEYKSIKRFCNQLTFIAIMLSILTIAGYKLASDARKQEHEYTSMVIGTITKPTSYKITIQYQNQPIDFNLLSPSGTEYNEYSKSNGSTAYTYTDDGSMITLHFNTSEYGDWILSYNHRYHNNNLKINVTELPYEGLVPTDIRAVIMDDELFFEFMPYSGTGKEHEYVNYYILGYTDGTNNGSCGIIDKDKHIIETNKKVSDTYEITDAFKSADYPNIRLVTYQTECNNSDQYYSNVIVDDIEIINTKTGEDDANETEEIQDTSN